MRISVIEGDPCQIVDLIYFRVELDGEDVPVFVAADEEEGYVLVWEPGALDQEAPRTVRRRGRVRIFRFEGDDVRHPEGTVGFVDPADGVWTWCSPEQKGYDYCLTQAQMVWDHHANRWHTRGHETVH